MTQWITAGVLAAHRRGERGAVLAMAGAMMLMFVAFVVVGVDVARLAFTASETQSVADAAALAAITGQVNGSVNPVADAETIALLNFVDADPAGLGSGPDDVVKSVVPGTWDFATDTFTETPGWTDPATNAAKADASATVDNLWAAVIDAPQSTVGRSAIAAAGGACAGQLAMPLALGQCWFDEFIASGGDCSEIPRFFQVPATGNTCFTSLGPSPASADEAKSFLPTDCCSGGNCGGGQPGPLVSVGDQVNVVNGQQDVLLKIIESCFLQGKTDWTIPVVECGQCNQQAEVMSFARVHITNVIATGNPDERGIYLDSVCKTEPGTTIGCTNTGFIGLALVK